MTQLILKKQPESKVKSCADCPFFDNYNEPDFIEIDGLKIENIHGKGRGWCKCFDRSCRAHHEITSDCVNSFSSSNSAEEKPSVAKPILKSKKPVPSPSEDRQQQFRVVKTWDNGGVYWRSRVISVLVQPTDYSSKPFWESVFLSQGIERGDILERGRGERLIKVS